MRTCPIFIVCLGLFVGSRHMADGHTAPSLISQDDHTVSDGVQVSEVDSGGPASENDEALVHEDADRENDQRTGAEDDDELSELSAAEIFERRMLPLLRSERGSSCTECHFGGVELSSYIQEDQAMTFAALRDNGLIDVHKPEDSKILHFISRRTDKTDPLIEKVRRAEYRAFRSWILAVVREPGLTTVPDSKVSIGTELPNEVVRHMRRDRVLRMFVDNVWSEMGRCINCHSPERNERLIREHGDQISWIVPRDPVETLTKLVEGGNIDTDDPEESMLLLKPVGLEDHGGGPKFALGSRTEKNFRRFLNDYAAVVNGTYRRADQLPQPSAQVTILTDQQLRIVHLPATLDKKLLKVDIYRWLDDRWSESPWGTADNLIHGKRQLWQSMVTMVAPRGSRRADQLRAGEPARLPAGRYLIKIYVDQDGRMQANRDLEFSQEQLYGQIEIEGEWPPGYQPPKIVRAPDRG